ncbi:hypothetical protein [Prauserella muralis]|uniref:Uncharacterized protein n=1 Tax=Prauserella muralis TaxID=588067 RepID=A0A2V4AP23_9PSEU|nr:hypothetical protein [Prauserella muralis]PXY20886.1 hypothetical protein BAY60_25620 [Prauserella muralis]TWE29927.1 hypothetical protein FHX69_2620 [Prauserella muralis]
MNDTTANATAEPGQNDGGAGSPNPDPAHGGKPAEGAEGTEGAEGGEGGDGPDSLGDKGKKALDAMKAKERAARAKARELEQQLAEMKAQLEGNDKTPDEQALEAARREAATEAARKANERILRSEIRAAAAKRLADPADALVHLNVDDFEVGDDGEVDGEEISDAITELLKKKPYLAAQGGTPSFDSARGKGTPKGQLTRADLKGMSAKEINAARKAGRLDAVLGKLK